MTDMKFLFEPQSVAVIGASQDPHKIGTGFWNHRYHHQAGNDHIVVSRISPACRTSYKIAKLFYNLNARCVFVIDSG
jgi:hypothetical protein